MEAQQRPKPVTVVLASSGIDNVHILPCSTRYNGEAKVRQYFENPIRKEEACLKTSLLGNDLKGVQTVTRKGNVVYYGQLNDNKSDRKLILEKVDHLTEWTKDLPREANESGLLHMQQWLLIQRAIHSID